MTTDERSLAGAAAVVVAGEGTTGERIARALRDEGVGVALATEVDRASIEAAFEEATQLGTLEMVVHAHVPAVALAAAPLVDGDDDSWDSAVDAPVLATLTTLQAARRRLGAGGRILVVVPAIGLTGLSWQVPLCTAAEAQRALVKSAARAWGDAGIAVNVLGARLVDLGGDGHAGGGVRSASLAAWGGDDLVAAAMLLLRRGARRTTGVTLVADAGLTMLP